MKQLIKLGLAAAAGALASGTIVYAQASAPEPHVIVSLYRAAPGQQEALLRWFADQDRAAKAAGLPATQLYIHTSGDSWDFMGIGPVTTPAQDDATDAAAKKLGIAYGPRASLEFRKYIALHTDTTSVGPMTAEQALARISKM